MTIETGQDKMKKLTVITIHMKNIEETRTSVHI